jgi:predicted acylesterase/phospholipase RssA
MTSSGGTPQEVLCFAGGPGQLAMGVGVAHAYLAIGECPKHLVGMSLGALSAARLQRVFGLDEEEAVADLQDWLRQVEAFPEHLGRLWGQSLPNVDEVASPGDARPGVRERAEMLRLLVESKVSTASIAGALKQYRRRANAKKPLALLAFAPIVTRIVADLARLAFRDRRSTARGVTALKAIWKKRETIPSLFQRACLRDLLGAVMAEAQPLSSSPPSLSIVVTALQDLPQPGGQSISQFVLDPGSDLVGALVDAATLPGLIGLGAPRAVSELRGTQSHPLGDVTLVDAAFVRSNPLPGFFRRFAGRDPFCIRLVYGIPYEERRQAIDAASWGAARVGATALDARQREDIDLERRHTWVTTLLLRELDEAKVERPTTHCEVVVSPIAPNHDREPATFADLLGWGDFATPARIEERASEGCRHLLEARFAEELHELKQGDGWTADCHDFLADRAGKPSMPVLCAQCPKKLRPPRELELHEAAVDAGPGGDAGSGGDAKPCEVSDAVLDKPAGAGARASVRLSDRIHQKLGQRRRRSRVVMLAEGGVFKGSFQVGAMAALASARLTPDIIAGASIGTGMGAFTAALMSEVGRAGSDSPTPAGDELPAAAQRILAASARAFVDVEPVAQTKRFKETVKRVLGHLREANITPKQVFDALVDGEDAKAAATIAKLLDADHGPFEQAIGAFRDGDLLAGFQGVDDGLATWSLGQADYLIGTEGLAKVINDVLGAAAHDPAADPQPFLDDGIAFFATATQLETAGQVLLGSNLYANAGAKRWSFANVLFASSAFPAMFRPVSNEDLHPGVKTKTAHLIDGGVFDNLPAIPAVDMLAALQVGDADLMTKADPASTARRRLHERLDAPDLVLVVSLSLPPVGDAEKRDTVEMATRRRSQTKLRVLENGNRRIRGFLEKLVEAEGNGRDIWDEIVNLDLLVVQPDHLNGAFHFEPAVGLKDETLDASIVDGCFQTLRALAEAADQPKGNEALKHVIKERRATRVHLRTHVNDDAPECVFFVRGNERRAFSCPFASIRGRSDNSLRTVCERVETATFRARVQHRVRARDRP